MLKREDLEIAITLKNTITIFYAWKDVMQFVGEIKNEQILINLLLVDVLNNTKYKNSLIIVGVETGDLKPLIREGTNLYAFKVKIDKEEQVVEFKIPRIEYYTQFQIYKLTKPFGINTSTHLHHKNF